MNENPNNCTMDARQEGIIVNDSAFSEVRHPSPPAFDKLRWRIHQMENTDTVIIRAAHLVFTIEFNRYVHFHLLRLLGISIPHNNYGNEVSNRTHFF